MQACSTSWSLHGGSVAKANTQANTCMCLLVMVARTLAPKCQRQRQARTLNPPPPCIVVKQLQALDRSAGASWRLGRKGKHLQVLAWRNTSWRHAGSTPCNKGRNEQDLVPAGHGGTHSPPRATKVDTSKHLESNTAVHRGAGAKFLDQSELHVYVTRCVLSVK